MRYRAFISYSHADGRWAGQLHRQLEAYRLPSRLRGATGEHGALPERLTPIFRDRDDLSSAGHLGPQIEAALADSEALVVVCSPDAARSAYVESEIRTFKRLGRGSRIYAFIVAGEPNAGDARECFPHALRFDIDPDDPAIEVPANPIAADARPGRDGRTLATLKLLAGLFGLPLDTLRQREAHRRHQRMAAITGLAVLVMLVTSVLAVQAVLARKDAERRQKQAEALVNFMLGDLNDKLSQVNRLDILTAVNSKAMEYFKSMPKTDVTEESLAQRAKALVQIGSVRIEQGQLKEAMDSFRSAAELSESLASASPADVPRQLAYADVLAYIGMTHWYQGDLEGAQNRFDAAHRILESARKHAPDNGNLLFQMSTVDNNNGHVLEARGHFSEATENYDRMLQVTRRLATLDPGKVDWLKQLGLAHNNLAKMALLQGDLPGAIASYRADEAIGARLAVQDPQNNAQRERLLMTRAALGRTLAMAGQPQAGSELQRQALEEADRLLAIEPNSSSYQYDVGLYALQRARIERSLGHATAAEELVARSLSVLQAMVAASPDQPAWQRDYAEALVEEATQRIAGGRDIGLARARLQAALKTLEPQLADNPQERGTVLATTNAWLRLASISGPRERKALADRALASIKAQRSARRDPRLLALELDALAQLGRAPEAKQVATALASTGYRDAALSPAPSQAAAATQTTHR